MLARLRRALPTAIGLVLFVAALEVLRTELRAVTWHELVRDVASTPRRQLGLALLVTVLNYGVLTGYDFLALAYIGKRLAPARVAGLMMGVWFLAVTAGDSITGLLSNPAVGGFDLSGTGMVAVEATLAVLAGHRQ